MAWVPSVELRDGEHFIHTPPDIIMKSLERERNRIVNKFTLMDYIDEKYIYGFLRILCTFSKETCRKYDKELEIIFNDGLDKGDLW